MNGSRSIARILKKLKKLGPFQLSKPKLELEVCRRQKDDVRRDDDGDDDDDDGNDNDVDKFCSSSIICIFV